MYVSCHFIASGSISVMRYNNNNNLLAIGPSTTQSHRGFYALCCPSGLPSISQHHDVASHPFYPFYPAFATASLSLGTVGFLGFPFSRRLGTRFAVSDYGCVTLPSLEV